MNEMIQDGNQTVPEGQQTENNTNGANTNQPKGETQQTTLPQTFKVKYNHQETEIPYEQAVQYVQKGMNYDKAIERARQEAAQQARDAWIAEQGYVWKGKSIKTEAEYKQALKEKEIEDNIRQKYNHVPDEVLEELIESKRFREETLSERKAKEEAERKAKEEAEYKEREAAMYSEFLNEFPEYDTEEKWKSIPKEAIIDADKWLKTGGKEGRRLTDAFIYYQRKAELQQQKIQTANSKNANDSTGSVKSSGSTNAFISKEQFEANKADMNWVRNNLKSIEESMKHW